MVYDLRDDPIKMQEYLALYSAYCSGNKQETEVFLQNFMRKHYSSWRP